MATCTAVQVMSTSESMAPQQTPSKSPTSTFRLLYRGALSLPDSHLLLDGLTFAARLDTTASNAGMNLLQNPLALALESMRGRPNLRFMGVTKLKDVWMDQSGDVAVDIHPFATLTRIYFENIFCLLPLPFTRNSSNGCVCSEVGIKIALGDNDGPDTTEIIIFARSLPLSPHKLQLTVARITPAPPPPSFRLPRPDDPTPRRPPIILGQNFGQTGNGRKRQRSSGGEPSGSGSVAASLGCGVRVGIETKDASKGVFKVPVVPARAALKEAKGKGKLKISSNAPRNEEDVFGMGASIDIENKGKRKRADDMGRVDETEMEKANKTVIKKSAVHHLTSGISATSISDPTPQSCTPISKSHPEFKELFGWVYRGVGFALRTQMKTTPVDLAVVDRLVQVHVGMYISGLGGAGIQGSGPSSASEV